MFGKVLLQMSGVMAALAIIGQAADSPKQSEKTLSQRLEQKIDVKIRRTPLQDAIAEIGRLTDVTFTLDGDSLKQVGYTRNMTVDMIKGDTEAIGILRAIIKRFPEIRVVLDEDQEQAIVTTAKGAKEPGVANLVIQAQPDTEISKD